MYIVTVVQKYNLAIPQIKGTDWCPQCEVAWANVLSCMHA